MHNDEVFTLIRQRLFTAVIGDVMDLAGLRNQFLPPEIRPLTPEIIIVGRAMPVLGVDVAEEDRGVAEDPYGLMFGALDDLKRGEVYLIAGGSHRYALWGGLMSARAAALGAAGAVLDGFHRDTREILDLRFPVFSAGAYAQDQRQRGRAVDFRCPVTYANGCRVTPGDLIVGDIDGVLAIPADHLTEVVEAALARVTGEDVVRRMILGGKSSEEAFNETGIM